MPIAGPADAGEHRSFRHGMPGQPVALFMANGQFPLLSIASGIAETKAAEHLTHIDLYGEQTATGAEKILLEFPATRAVQAACRGGKQQFA